MLELPNDQKEYIAGKMDLIFDGIPFHDDWSTVFDEKWILRKLQGLTFFRGVNTDPDKYKFDCEVYDLLYHHPESWHSIKAIQIRLVHFIYFATNVEYYELANNLNQLSLSIDLGVQRYLEGEEKFVLSLRS